MERYKNMHSRATIRLRNWDYGSPGYYYVTICTKGRMQYFGDVVMPDEIPDEISGEDRCEATCDGFAGTHNHASPDPTAAVAQRLVRLAHSEAIIQLTPIGKIAYPNWVDIPTHFPFVVLDEFVIMPDHLHGILNFKKPGYRERNVNSFGPQSQNLGSVIRGYKSATKSYAASHGIQFAWQGRYHDDVITSGRDLQNIRNYIRSNPAKWMEKKLARQGINQPTTI